MGEEEQSAAPTQDTERGPGFRLQAGEGTTMPRILAAVGFARVVQEASVSPSTVAWGVRAVGFWLAVIIPFLYLPLVYRGFTSQIAILAFVGLVLLNVVALVVGHGYRR